MMNRNPQLTALALLVQKFGKRIEGGGFEVEVSAEEMMKMSPYGEFREVPTVDQRTVKWQYFPNYTIEGEVITQEGVTPNSVTEKADGQEQLRDSDE